MHKLTINKDLDNKTITITRRFDSPQNKVWKAFTSSQILDKWWAPKPWKAITKSQEFKEGGRWLYYMESPEGEKSWSYADYEIIDPENSFKFTDGFCDENGVENKDFPSTHWLNEFYSDDEGTIYTVTLTFDDAEKMEKLIAMQFEGGFEMGLNNLDELLSSI